MKTIAGLLALSVLWLVPDAARAQDAPSVFCVQDSYDITGV
jgi:hypothetical protein